MAIKSEVESRMVSEEKSYPCLKIGKVSGTVVLFTHERTGTVVGGGVSHRAGDYSFAWTRSDFKPFNGKVTLSNEKD